MPLARRLSLSLLTCVATLWAGSLIVAGLQLASQGFAAWDPSAPVEGPWRALGLALAAGGQFVFMVLVADRWFPGAGRRRAVRVAEGVFAALALLAVLIAGVRWFTGMF